MSLVEYLKETRVELKHVTFPTRKQTIFYTIVVIIVSVATAYLLYFFDTSFAFAWKNFILK